MPFFKFYIPRDSEEVYNDFSVDMNLVGVCQINIPGLNSSSNNHFVYHYLVYNISLHCHISLSCISICVQSSFVW